MGDVVDFNAITNQDLDPNKVLTAAIDQLDSVVLIGYDKNGNEYFASSIADGADVVWLLERLKFVLMQSVDGDY